MQKVAVMEGRVDETTAELKRAEAEVARLKRALDEAEIRSAALLDRYKLLVARLEAEVAARKEAEESVRSSSFLLTSRSRRGEDRRVERREERREEDSHHSFSFALDEGGSRVEVKSRDEKEEEDVERTLSEIERMMTTL
mmetsp:Transcript_27076/g.69688  ORF Transcript_27076/g.69688 Transcript_27076/m.69688 type:complete len:140 (+) Transcript_27076:349-768(+)